SASSTCVSRPSRLPRRSRRSRYSCLSSLSRLSSVSCRPCLSCLSCLPCLSWLPCLSCLSRSHDPPSGHRFSRQNRVEAILVQQTALEHELANRSAALHRLLRDFRRRRITDIRTERGCCRGAAFEQLARARLVRGDPVDAAQPE